MPLRLSLPLPLHPPSPPPPPPPPLRLTEELPGSVVGLGGTRTFELKPMGSTKPPPLLRLVLYAGLLLKLQGEPT